MFSQNKYEKGKIYKIWSLETSEVYVGSTCSELYKRMSKHRCEAKCRAKFRLHHEMNRLGCDVFMIELVEHHPCSCANELHKREGEIIRELGASSSI